MIIEDNLYTQDIIKYSEEFVSGNIGEVRALVEESGRHPTALHKSYYIVQELQKPHPRERKFTRSRSAFVSPVR